MLLPNKDEQNGTQPSRKLTKPEVDQLLELVSQIEDVISTSLIDAEGKITGVGSAILSEIETHKDSPNSAISYYRKLKLSKSLGMTYPKFLMEFPHMHKALIAGYLSWKLEDSIAVLESAGITWDALLGQVDGLWEHTS